MKILILKNPKNISYLIVKNHFIALFILSHRSHYLISLLLLLLSILFNFGDCRKKEVYTIYNRRRGVVNPYVLFFHSFFVASSNQC